MDFTGRTAIITGGSSGIGRAITEGIVKRNGKVIILDFDEEKTKETILKLGADSVVSYFIDLSNLDEIPRCLKKIKNDGYKVDILINNAGIVSTKPFLEISQKELDKVMKINLYSVFILCQELCREMKNNGYGKIVNIASVAGKIGGGLLGTSAYATSKAAVIGLTKAIAKEMAHANITCNAICPSLTNTAMTSSMSKEKKEVIINSILLNRAAKPEEIANVALFYSSDLSSFVTGEIADVDGGITLD